MYFFTCDNFFTLFCVYFFYFSFKFSSLARDNIYDCRFSFYKVKKIKNQHNTTDPSATAFL